MLLFAAAELQSILEPFLLRRVKSEVALDLPKKTELVVYHGMSALQKKYYKALLLKDRGETSALCTGGRWFLEVVLWWNHLLLFIGHHMHEFPCFCCKLVLI